MKIKLFNKNLFHKKVILYGKPTIGHSFNSIKAYLEYKKDNKSEIWWRDWNVESRSEYKRKGRENYYWSW